MDFRSKSRENRATFARLCVYEYNGHLQKKENKNGYQKITIEDESDAAAPDSEHTHEFGHDGPGIPVEVGVCGRGNRGRIGGRIQLYSI
jgi:hypothetical protein